jgi:hypothetical protein
MDLIVGLLLTAHKFDSICVIVDRSPNLLTSYLSTPATMFKSMLRST